MTGYVDEIVRITLILKEVGYNKNSSMKFL